MWWLKSHQKKLSPPDWLSLYRILSAPLLITLLFLNQRIGFAAFLLVSFSTDALDGFLARRLNIVSQRGAQLDSIGDAITFMVGLGGIMKFETDFFLHHLNLIVFTFGLYLVQLFIAYWRYGMPSSFHTYLAKISAIFQAVFMLWLFFVGVEIWLFYIAVAFSIIETVEEILLILLFPRWKADVKGLFWILNTKEK